jgi:hypothetical protein
MLPFKEIRDEVSTSFCEQKEAKKLFYAGAGRGHGQCKRHRPRDSKNFWFFF